MDLCDQYKKGYVYFIRAGYFGPIKIGFTNNIKKRMIHIQTNCPDKIFLMGMIKTNDATEAEYHQMFNDYKMQGEWFAPVPKLMDFIEGVLEHEKGCIYYDPEDPDQWEGMSEKQWNSWLRYKERYGE